MLNEGQKLELVKLSEALAPMEICGLVVKANNGTGGVWVLPVTNVAKDPYHHFEMNEQQLRAAFAFYEVVGTYHSHPNGPAEPSTTDMLYANPSLRHWLVVDGKVLEWSKDGVGT